MAKVVGVLARFQALVEEVYCLLNERRGEEEGREGGNEEFECTQAKSFCTHSILLQVLDIDRLVATHGREVRVEGEEKGGKG